MTADSSHSRSPPARSPGLLRPEDDAIVDEFRSEASFYLAVTEKTVTHSYYTIRKYLNMQEDLFPASFTRENVMKFLRDVSESRPHHRDKPRRAASTVNNILKSLRQFSRWAVERGYIETEITAGIKLKQERDRLILAPDMATITRVLDAVKTHGSDRGLIARNYCLLLWLADTGMRASEALGINLEDVKDDVVIVNGKGDRDRQVPISPPVRAAIDEWLEWRRPLVGVNALFINQFGEPMRYETLRNLLSVLSRKLSVKVAAHDFRRFALTEMWLAGVSQTDGMLLSGHKRVDVYQRYLHAAMQARAVATHREKGPLALMGRTS